jgi:hypothetical protein
MKHNLSLSDKKYSEKILEKNIKLFTEWDWFFISRYQNLSEQFTEKNVDKLHWGCISCFKKLSECFL